MTSDQLRNSILQEAISGRLVPQDPNDEPASALLARIREEKARLVKEGKLKKKDLVETPITDDEKPFEIPDSWEWVRLKNIVSILGDGIHGTPEYDIHGAYYFVNGNNLSHNRIILKGDTKRVNEREYLKYRKILNETTILVSINGTIGNVGHYNGEPVILGKSACYYNLMDAALKPYITTLMYTDYFLKYAKGNATGSTIKNVSLAVMNDFIVPLPPLAEQKRIVAKLEELLPIVEQYGKAQKELDLLNAALPARLRQSILQEAISGKLVPQDEKDEPAGDLLDRVQLEKQRLVKEKVLKAKDIVVTPIPEDELPFDIPETWSWCRLGELAVERMGKTPPRGESEYWLNAKYPWVSISDMKDYGHVKTTKEGVSEIAAQKAFRQISPIGSLLMSFKLTVGRTAILDIDAYHNEAIITIQPYVDREYAFRNYLFYVLPLLANLGDSKDAIKGKTLNSTSLYNLYIPLPPLAEQQRIVSKIEELFEQIDQIKK